MFIMEQWRFLLATNLSVWCRDNTAKCSRKSSVLESFIGRDFLPRGSELPDFPFTEMKGNQIQLSITTMMVVSVRVITRLRPAKFWEIDRISLLMRGWDSLNTQMPDVHCYISSHSFSRSFCSGSSASLRRKSGHFEDKPDMQTPKGSEAVIREDHTHPCVEHLQKVEQILDKLKNKQSEIPRENDQMLLHSLDRIKSMEFDVDKTKRVLHATVMK
ncbi:hypothetical protein POM88_046922 [Heracleum sosnowskyi]|uniref:Uncharacterized protein n=1 Tax=Heracleum sosnowskyi TaxID=360622 RepID=A0AAD8M801_9APIA|nr:hypothetical protein POM88_046922 [Heracleum sosnowskyi]